MELFGLDATVLSLAIVAIGFVLFAGIELLVPFRRLTQPRLRRWVTNLALFALDSLALRILLPLAMIGAALVAEDRGWGLFNALDWPLWLEALLTILLLDLALYFQHWATHRIPLLWRMHRVHHVDRDFDITTAARFHPFEIVLSMVYKMGVVALFGMAPLAVFVFVTGFTVLTLWTHSNLSLPPATERVVRAAIVTPDMHRIHHSVIRRETDSNYGTFLSGWDRLFGTYVGEASRPQRSIAIGLANYQDDRPTRFGWSLLVPFLPDQGEERHE
ncbi:sterol desaturase family protein [Parerythrobacter lacustris]|uniref:Sterol desaturase family protein n=1 Tax=Parerythrobacter lacustris TaxID=2969984 RepID=A0ABT1XMW9_9SPHN|nr:sterol desaturase family protein [Parerythrobacter lacustris]MCR2832619.1 sterol desaturase family protein [Parerythrobacter lacustris]